MAGGAAVSSGTIVLPNGARTDPTSKGMMRLYLILSLFCLQSANNGFDGSLQGSINAMDQFLKYGFDHGLITAIAYVGQMLAVFFIGPLMDNYGRIKTVGLGSIIILIGVSLQTSATTTAQLMVGRVIGQFGVTLCSSTAPSYIAEMAPPDYRGRITGFYNTCWYLGNIIASWSCYGSINIDSTWAWRLPLALQAVPSLLTLAIVWFMPESPRWLISKGRESEALVILARYHADGDDKAPLVEFEFNEMCASIRADVAAKASYKSPYVQSYVNLVNRRSSFYRTALAVVMAFFGQWSGNAVISYFFSDMLNAAGITSSNTQLLINSIASVVNFICAIFGSQLVDRFGRRTLLLTGFACCVGGMAIVCGGSAGFVEQGSLAASYISVVGILLFQAMFSFFLTSMQVLYAVEVYSNANRATGMGVMNFFMALAIFFNSYNHTLEELDEVFESPNPVKTSLTPKMHELATDMKS
ncbi:hypothetical protein HDU82_008939 [Entophlyctis luteolus]|nr:hypothetical protein HDU82_008939 [Entophlyctis luteolus]